MKVISHRGNLYGKSEVENNPLQVKVCLERNIECEIDVRWVNDEWFLGHDTAEYNIPQRFLIDNKDMLWCHAKNVEALEKMMELNLHCFWHQSDQYTITSRGVVWAYPEQYTSRGVLVLPSKSFIDKHINNVYGICVDNPMEYL